MKAKSLRRRFVPAYSDQLEQRMLLSSGTTIVPGDLLSVVSPVPVTQPDAITAAVNAALSMPRPADPIYMKYAGISGDVTAAGFQGDIELNAFQWGVGRANQQSHQCDRTRSLRPEHLGNRGRQDC